MKESLVSRNAEIVPITVEYDSAVAAAAERLDFMQYQSNIMKWSMLKTIYDCTESVISEFRKLPTKTGRLPKGTEKQTMARVYRDIAKSARFWSPTTIKKYHILYSVVYKRLGGDHEAVLSIEANPSNVEDVVMAKVPTQKQNELFQMALDKNITRQKIRAAVKKAKGKLSPKIIFDSTLWQASRFDPEYGVDGVPGRTPGQIMYNIFYHFVNPESMCYFPFFGSGTEGDVAKEFQCEYRGWDIDEYDIVAEKHGNRFFRHDSTKPWPVKSSSADFILMDPPRVFFEDGTYDDKVSALDVSGWDGFMLAMGSVIKHADKTLRVGGRLAVLLRQPYSSMIPYEDMSFYLHQEYLTQLFDFVRRVAISFPRNIKPVEGLLTDGFLDLLVYEKH